MRRMKYKRKQIEIGEGGDIRATIDAGVEVVHYDDQEIKAPEGFTRGFEIHPLLRTYGSIQLIHAIESFTLKETWFPIRLQVAFEEAEARRVMMVHDSDGYRLAWERVPLEVTVTMAVPHRDTSDPIIFRSCQLWTRWARSDSKPLDRQFAEFVRYMIGRALNHELDEHIHMGDDRIFDPHRTEPRL